MYGLVLFELAVLLSGSSEKVKQMMHRKRFSQMSDTLMDEDFEIYAQPTTLDRLEEGGVPEPVVEAGRLKTMQVSDDLDKKAIQLDCIR